MPQPPEVVALERELLAAYRQAWSRIEAELRQIQDQPLQAIKANRLRAMQQRISAVLGEVERASYAWLGTVLPKVYWAGVTKVTQGAQWGTIHQQAVQQLVNRSYTDLLEATEFIRSDVKSLIREVVRSEALQKAIEGRTARAAGREVTRILDAQGVGVIYKDGSKHPLSEYGQMVIRTVSGTAYNVGTLTQGRELGFDRWEVFDGEDCGWTDHDDPDLANGKVVTTDEGLANPLAHPNCRRAFGVARDTPVPVSGDSGRQVA